MRGWGDRADHAEGRHFDNGQSVITGPGGGLQIFDARCVFCNELKLADLVGHTAHSRFFEGLLRDALGVGQGLGANGCDNGPALIQALGFQRLLCFESGLDGIFERVKDPVVAFAFIPSERGDHSGGARLVGHDAAHNLLYDGLDLGFI